MPRTPSKRTPPQPSLLPDSNLGASSDAIDPTAPLAARMRPHSLDDYVGQEHIVGPGKLLRRLIEAGQLPSIILWGPPGSGKTTLARIIAAQSNATFVALSAVSAGVADLRRVVAEAQDRRLHPSFAAKTPPSAHPEALERSADSDLRSPLAATAERGLGGEVVPRTILFIDEIHRFNKAQQDAVLPYVEDGTVTLIGATTENPSFEVIGPLLSRSRVFTLRALDEAQLAQLLRRAVTDPIRGLGALNIDIDDDALEALAASTGGDARIALNALESAALSVTPSPRQEPSLEARTSPSKDHAEPVEAPSDRTPNLPTHVRPQSPNPVRPEPVEGRDQAHTPDSSSLPGSEDQTPTKHPEPVEGPSPSASDLRSPLAATAERGLGGEVRHLTRPIIEEALQHRTYLYDRQGDAHYDTISAFIKSLRGSDPDAALYWLARMIEAGEDPLFIVRRMVILASEDIGLADPHALGIATACQQAVHFIGMPEGFYPLAETALYLALAPKSNSVGSAYTRALADVELTRNDPVPLHLRNAVTGLMKGLGYGRGYQYAHNYEGGIAPDQTYLPDRLRGHRYYEPRSLGAEPDLANRHQPADAPSTNPPTPRRQPPHPHDHSV